MLFSETEIQTTASRLHKERAKQRFLKGPVPLPDLAAAARLPGRALALYVAILHQADLTRSPRVKLPRVLLDMFGIDKDAKSRGLKVLEQAGLISIQHKPGCNPTATVEKRLGA
jgi:hypothetical protein